MDEGLLELVLGVLVDVFLVVGDYRLGNGLSDSIDLGSVTTTGNADSDIDTGELVKADDKEGFVDLESEDFRLCESQRLAVNLDEALACLALGDRSSRLLLAEALHTLRSSHID